MSSVFMKNVNKVPKKKYFILVLLLCLLVSICIAAGFLFHLETIKVTGCSFYTEESIQTRFEQSVFDQNTILFYIKYKYLKTVSIPFVDEYDMEFVTPREIHITIYEKSLISCIRYMGEYLYLDKDGVVDEISEKRMEKIPLVTGVAFQQMKLYDKLSVEDDTIFDTILDLSLLIQRYNLDIDRIYFDAGNDVTLYSGDIKILLGKRDNYDDQIADLKNLLPLAEEKNLSGTLDMENYDGSQEDVILRKD